LKEFLTHFTQERSPDFCFDRRMEEDPTDKNYYPTWNCTAAKARMVDVKYTPHDIVIDEEASTNTRIQFKGKDFGKLVDPLDSYALSTVNCKSVLYFKVFF